MNADGRLASQLCVLLIFTGGADAWAQEPAAPPQQQAVPELPPAPQEQPTPLGPPPTGQSPAPETPPSPQTPRPEPPGLPPPPMPPIRPPFARHVVAIEFKGNTRTRPEVMRREIGIDVGAPATAGQIEAARQAIMDLGLFEWVTVQVEPAPEGETLIFAVKEKIYFVPIPLLNGDPSKQDYSYGLELRADNLGGWNQGLRLKYEEDVSAAKDVPLSRSGSVSYTWPRVAATPYNLDLGYSLTQQDFNVLDTNNNITASYHRNITSMDVIVSRWLNFNEPNLFTSGSHGWSAGVGLVYQQQAYTFLSGTVDGRSTQQAMSMIANIGWNDVHDKGIYFTGSAYGWRAELGDRFLGSDFDFTRHLFYYRVYDAVTDRSNLNWQLRIGFADGHPFGGPAYSIGGFTTLRGYEGSITGNALALSNLEYHRQLGGYPAIRGLWFLDVGNTWNRVTDMDPDKLEAGTGFGLRWRIRSLVNVTLSADAAYGIGPRKKVFYLMTTSSF